MGRAARSSADDTAEAGDSDEVMTVPDVIRRYPKQWILLGVSAVDSKDQPNAGKVLLHSKSQRSLVDSTIAMAPYPGGFKKIYVFFADARFVPRLAE